MTGQLTFERIGGLPIIPSLCATNIEFRQAYKKSRHTPRYFSKREQRNMVYMRLKSGCYELFNYWAKHPGYAQSQTLTISLN